jgi:hypothetical protein
MPQPQQENDCGLSSCLTLSKLLGQLKQRYKSGLITYGINDSIHELIKHNPVPNVPGIVTICGIYGVNQLELVSILSSGPTSIHHSGIRSKLTRKTKNMSQDNFLKEQFKLNDYRGLLIWWYATMEAGNNDLPSYVSHLILNTYFKETGKLPPGYV